MTNVILAYSCHPTPPCCLCFLLTVLIIQCQGEYCSRGIWCFKEFTPTSTFETYNETRGSSRECLGTSLIDTEHSFGHVIFCWSSELWALLLSYLPFKLPMLLKTEKSLKHSKSFDFWSMDSISEEACSGPSSATESILFLPIPSCAGSQCYSSGHDPTLWLVAAWPPDLPQR